MPSSLSRSVKSYLSSLKEEQSFRFKQKSIEKLNNDVSPEDAIKIGTSDFGDIAFNRNILRTDTRGLIVGTSGSGKSYLTRNIIETICRSPIGRNSTNPRDKVIHIFDPEGDFFNLRENNAFDFVILGKKNCDLIIDQKNAGTYATISWKNKINCIIDFQFVVDEEEQLAIAIEWNNALLRISDPDAAETNYIQKVPLFVFMDEAHLFAKKSDPSILNLQSKAQLKNIAKTGRKRRIIPFFITQRITDLHTQIIAECNTWIVGKTEIEADLKRNGATFGLKPKQLPLLQTLNKQFLIKGPAFIYNHDPELGTIRLRSNPTITKHGKENMEEGDPLFFPPNDTIKNWIEILSGKIIDNKEEIPIKNKMRDTKKSIPEKILENSLNSSRIMQELNDPKNCHELWFHIACYFESISIKNLYLLSIRDDYNEISSAMEIKLFFKEYKNLFIQTDDTIWFNPKNPNDISEKSKVELKKSDYYINLWKLKMSNLENEKILQYLYEDENCDNSKSDIMEATGLDRETINNFIQKYSGCGLVSVQDQDVYLNTIFFHPKIHDNKFDSEFEEGEELDNENYFDDMDENFIIEDEENDD